MRLMLVHLKVHLVEFLRQPSYVVTSLLFPTMFFAFFGVPNIEHKSGAILLTGSFACFAVIGISFFQLTINIANDRDHSFAKYLRTLNFSFPHFVAAKSLAYFFLSALAVACVLAYSWLSVSLEMPTAQWFKFLSAIAFGFLPFSALGFAVGSLVSAKNSVPVGNLIYLPLSFAGGLWMPPHVLPQKIQTLSKYLPTRHYGNLVWEAGLRNSWDLAAMNKLVLFTGICLLVAWGVRKQNFSK